MGGFGLCDVVVVGLIGGLTGVSTGALTVGEVMCALFTAAESEV